MKTTELIFCQRLYGINPRDSGPDSAVLPPLEFVFERYGSAPKAMKRKQRVTHFEKSDQPHVK